MIRCDNPTCGAHGRPEYVPGVDGPKRKGARITPPYGWHDGEVVLVGCGPRIYFTACSAGCVGPAVEAMFQEAYDRDHSL